MKVKLFSFRLKMKGQSIFGGSPDVVNGDEIEAAKNEWLASRPGIRVERVQQTTTGASGLGCQFLYVTVWYRENAE